MSLATSSPLSNGGSEHIAQNPDESQDARLERLRDERRKRVEVYHRSEYFAALERVVKALTELHDAFGEVLERDTAEVELIFLHHDLLDDSGMEFIERVEGAHRDAISFAWTVKNLAGLFWSDWPYVPWPEAWLADATAEIATEDDATPCAIVGGKGGA